MKMPFHRLNQALIAVLLTVCGCLPAHAIPFQSHSGITQAVKKFVLQQNVPLSNVQVRVTSLNNQLQVPQCSKALRVDMAPGTKLLGNSSFSVSCPAPQKWKIHVAANIDGEVDAIVARYPILRGTIIQNENMEFVKRRYSQLNRGYYASAKFLANMEAKRNIRAGQVLTPGLLKAQKLVMRGQHITIVAQTGGLNLRVKGKALMDGQMGQTIKVKNLTSKKLIYARVISEGMVRVNF